MGVVVSIVSTDDENLPDRGRNIQRLGKVKLFNFNLWRTIVQPQKNEMFPRVNQHILLS